MQNEFTKWTKDYGQNALTGTWARIGKSTYRRGTGEVVKKIGNAWQVQGGKAYLSRAAAFVSVDFSLNA